MTDQEMIREVLDLEGWRLILGIIQARIKGYTATALEPGSPVPAIRDAQCRINELRMLLLRIGEMAGVKDYRPV